MSDQEHTRDGDLDETLSFSVTGDLKEQVRQQANKRGCSMAEILRELVDREIASGREDTAPSGEPAVEDPTGGDRDEFGDLLLAGGVVVEEDVRPYVDREQLSTHPFVELLLDHSFPEEQQVASFLARHFDPPSVDLGEFTIHPDVLDLVPVEVVEEHLVLPVAQVGPVLFLTQIPPYGKRAFQVAHRQTGLKTVPIRCDEDQVRSAIRFHFDLSSQSIEEAMDRRHLRLRREEVERLEVEELSDPLRSAVMKDLRRNVESEWDRIHSSHRPLEPISISGLLNGNG